MSSVFLLLFYIFNEVIIMIIGYRTLASSFDSILVPFNEVLEFETKELCNVDIYLTMRERYNLKVDLRWNRDKCNAVVRNFLKEKYKGLELFCVWLCESPYNVKELYAHGDEEIIKVILPNNALLVSDLGYDGRLYIIHSGQTYSWNIV